MIPLSLVFTLAMLSLNVALYLTLKPSPLPSTRGRKRSKTACSTLASSFPC